MPTFSNSSRIKLETCHHSLITLCVEVVKDLDIVIVCGHRDEAAQDEAFRNGFSKTRWPMSRHNSYPSDGLDVAPYPVSWSDTTRFYMLYGYMMATYTQLQKGGQISSEFILASGCDWDRDFDIRDQSFQDLGHYELRPAESKVLEA